MSGNWLRTSFFGIALALAMGPAGVSAQEEGPGVVHALDAVVVTANRAEEKLREVTSNVTVITQEMIKKSSASDMGQLLRQQGLQVSGSNAGGKSLRIRGMESPQMNASDISTRVLVLHNGRRTGGPNVDWVGLANVERIEIIRGPSAVQYGPAGLGGVVNVITKRGGEKLGIRAEAGAGSYDLERFKLAASGQSETGLIDFSFGAGQQYQGDYKTGKGWTWEGTRTGNRMGFNMDLGVNFREGQRIGFDYNYFGIFGDESPSNSVNHRNPVQPAYGGASSHDVSNSNYAFTYEGATDDKAFTWMARVAAGKYEDDATWGTTKMDLSNLTATLGYDDGGFFTLSGGLDYMNYDMYTSSNTRPEYDDLGAFLSGKLRFLEDSLIFSAGGRFDSYNIKRGVAGRGDSQSDTNFSPSLGLAYLPVEWLKLRTNYSQGFKMPTPTELWGTSAWYDPNPGLKAEASKTWEVGLDVSWEFVTAGLTYFHSKWDNKIIGQQISGDRYRMVNLTGATIAGWELALSADLGQAFQRDFQLRPYVNFTYLPTRRNDDHSDSPNSATRLGFDTLTNTSKMTLAYGLDFDHPGWDLTANVNVNYAGEKLTQDWSDPAAGPPDWAAPWIKNTPGAIVDMSLEKGLVEFKDKGRLKGRLEINNLLDKYDEAYISYPGPGRNFYVGLVYEY